MGWIVIDLKSDDAAWEAHIKMLQCLIDEIDTMNLPDGTMPREMAVMLYFFCEQFLSVKSFQNKQAYLLYGAQFFRILQLLGWTSAG